jgi:hypothetical protein
MVSCHIYVETSLSICSGTAGSTQNTCRKKSTSIIFSVTFLGLCLPSIKLRTAYHGHTWKNPLNPANKQVFSVSKQASLDLAKTKVFVPM